MRVSFVFGCDKKRHTVISALRFALPQPSSKTHYLHAFLSPQWSGRGSFSFVSTESFRYAGFRATLKTLRQSIVTAANPSSPKLTGNSCEHWLAIVVLRYNHAGIVRISQSDNEISLVHISWEFNGSMCALLAKIHIVRYCDVPRTLVSSIIIHLLFPIKWNMLRLARAYRSHKLGKSAQRVKIECRLPNAHLHLGDCRYQQWKFCFPRTL